MTKVDPSIRSERDNPLVHQADSLKQLICVNKIVSGGQTGVDRAALDFAMETGIEHGGWCPRGRLAEDGRIDSRYQLMELASRQYVDRTRRNVLDTDGTLVLYTGTLQGGTFLTVRYAEQINKPCMKVRLTHPGKIDRVRDWLHKHNIHQLNVAGPRASKDPSIYDRTVAYLRELLKSLA
jgi:hypothetical protein